MCIVTATHPTCNPSLYCAVERPYSLRSLAREITLQRESEAAQLLAYVRQLKSERAVASTASELDKTWVGQSLADRVAWIDQELAALTVPSIQLDQMGVPSYAW